MFVRLVYESFRRQKRRKLLAGVAVTLGVCVATAMIAVATDIGDKINRELRRIGANLIVTPQEDTLDVEIGGVNLKPPSDGAFLNEADLPKNPWDFLAQQHSRLFAHAARKREVG